MPAAFDDPTEYLDDFGIDCLAGATTFKALFDQPDALRALGEVNAVSREFLLTYATADVTLQRSGSVVVGGVQYQVRETPRQVGDGSFSEATLTRV